MKEGNKTTKIIDNGKDAEG